jgi:hypothetical protein
MNHSSACGIPGLLQESQQSLTEPTAMLFLLFSVICLAGVALATPVATKRDVDLSTLSFISINSSLPKIA